MLTETWMRNDDHIVVPNFDSCVQFKREGERAGSVAIYKKRAAECLWPNRQKYFQ